MATLPLALATPVVTFDANGFARVSIGPARHNERWKVTRYVTQSPAVGCSLILYKNYESVLNVVDSTDNAVADVGGIQTYLHPGERLLWVWSNGISGNVVNGYVEGILEMRGVDIY